jgi:branched-chain amino acid transport system permease protein
MGILIAEQAINGLQLGIMLFLMAAGLTLVFGIMNFINLAHGSLYMCGAYCAATALRLTDSFVLAILAGFVASALVGLVLELVAVRRLYDRDHLDQVLATFGILMFANELTRIVWGNAALYASAPEALSGFVNLPGGVLLPVYRLVISAVGLLVACALFAVLSYTRFGMLVRAGAGDREMLRSLGVRVSSLFAGVFVLGAALAGLAGAMVGPLLSVEVGMGEPVLITAFVIVVIGGIGSMRGAFAGALIVGLVDTLGRALLPKLLGYTVGPALSSMSIYLVMALMLWLKPEGLFPVPSTVSDAGHAAQNPPQPIVWRQRAALFLGIATLLVVPFLGEPYYLRLLTRIMAFATAAISLNLIFGFGGMVSFGHAAFVGVGAYVVGIAAYHGIGDALLTWPAAVLISALFALVTGAIALRTSGVYFIMITLAFGQMLYFLGIGLEQYGGDNGLSLKLHSQISAYVTMADPLTLYLASVLAMIGAFLLVRRVVKSEFGLAIRGIRDNRARMRSVGYSTYKYQLCAFTLAGGLAGLAGAILVNVDSYAGPSSLHWFVSGELMIMVILGGAASFFGPIAGAATFLLLKEILSTLTVHWMAVMGPLLVLIVLFTRRGLSALVSRAARS